MGLLDQILGGMMGGAGQQARGGGLGDVLGQVLGGGQGGVQQPGGGGLGNVLGGVLGGGRAGGSGMNPILMAVLAMLAGKAVSGMMNRGASPQQGGGGGLESIIEQFKNRGMGSAFDSWVSTGQNQPVRGEQLEDMLGKEQLDAIAQQLGVPRDEARDQMAQVLPEVVDRLTPDGQLPSQGFGDIEAMLQSLLRGNR